MGNDAANVSKSWIFNNAIKVAYDFYLKHRDETLLWLRHHEPGQKWLGNGQYRLNLKCTIIRNE